MIKKKYAPPTRKKKSFVKSPAAHTPAWHASTKEYHPSSNQRPSSLCFFFSSRRLHTRLVSDWSSDVCSSDLVVALALAPLLRAVGVPDGHAHDEIGRASCRESLEISVVPVTFKKQKIMQT